MVGNVHFVRVKMHISHHSAPSPYYVISAKGIRVGKGLAEGDLGGKGPLEGGYGWKRDRRKGDLGGKGTGERGIWAEEGSGRKRTGTWDRYVRSGSRRSHQYLITLIES